MAQDPLPALVSKKNLMKLFGARVRELRTAKGLTQKALGARIDKDLQSIQRVERGAVAPSLYYLYELALGLEVELNELFDFKIQHKAGSKK